MKRKNRRANLIMAAVILLLMVAGILAVGKNQGWFDPEGQPVSIAETVQGITQLQRGGVAYPISEGMALRDGDLLETQKDACLTIRVGDSWLALNEETTVSVDSAEEDGFQMTVDSGEVFAAAGESTLVLLTSGGQITVEESVTSLSVQTGADTIFVYGGQVSWGEYDVAAGQQLLSTGGAVEISGFQGTSLNEFCIVQAMTAGETVTLCLSNEQLAQVLEDREAARLAAIEEQARLVTTEPSSTQETTETTEGTSPEETTPTETSSAETEAPSEVQTSEPVAPETESTEQTTEAEETTEEGTEPAANTCTISIRCSSILDNLDSLTQGKEAYVPSSGYILGTTTVEFTDGETVFDILKRVCAYAGIALEYSWTPAYNSYYIEGINYIYEFDCGPQSGWTYQVNGWSPNYGCSSYTVSQGDNIVWAYSCTGLGSDVGG